MDAHAKPPQSLRDVYKRYQKADPKTLQDFPDLLNAQSSLPVASGQTVARPTYGASTVEQRAAYAYFLNDDSSQTPAMDKLDGMEPPSVVECKDVPGKSGAKSPPTPSKTSPRLRKVGLFIYPDLLPPEIQLLLLDKLFHRDLSNPDHQTNIHMHYDIPYPKPQDPSHPPPSFFDQKSSTLPFTPKDPSIHKPLTTPPFLRRKLRWLTLGGQYDWTRKLYPSGPPPPFPPDIKQLLESLFPMMKAQAAIVNLYSPGDTLSLHRDVSEECDQPLVSVSLGCEGVFVVGLEAGVEGGEARAVTVRLRSGDAVLMSGAARYAWHGVPKVVAGTCPEWMEEWPAVGEGEERFEAWKGWMEGKRVNLNVRQMFE